MIFTFRNLCFFLISLFSCYLIYQICCSDHSFDKYFKLKNSILKINKELTTIHHKNVVLSRNILKLKKNQDYLKFVIRKRLGYVSDGEKLFLIH